MIAAALLFGTVVVVGVTVVALAALAYAKHLDTPDPLDSNDEDRCPVFEVWHGTGRSNKGTKCPHRCDLRVGHSGPHHIPHPMAKHVTDRDYWWADEVPRVVVASKDDTAA